MTIQHKRYKTATLTLGAELTDRSCQLVMAQVINNTADGDKVYTFCADGTGEFREDVDFDYQLGLKWRSDWTATGLNRYVETNDGETVSFSITFDPDDTAWSRTYTGTLVVKSPGDGGEVRAAEESEVTWNIIGKPVLTYES